MPLMLRKAELHAPQCLELETNRVAGLRLVRRGDDAGDDAVARPHLPAGVSKAPGHPLDHRLQPLGGLLARHRVLLLAVHEDPGSARLARLDARSERRAAVETVAGGG